MHDQSTQQLALTVQPAQVPLSEPFSPEDLNAAIEVLAPNKAGGLTFHAKVRATGTLYRFEPARYPREPRFWCISVMRCASGSQPDPSEPTWIGEAGLSWTEVAAAMSAIRADLGSWLAAPSRRDLCRWLMGTM